MIYDCFQFFNELDLLKLRLNTLSSVVDYFVITESDVTFSGIKKPLYYNENKDLFSEFSHKIIHNVVTDTPDGVDVSPFDRDAFQKKARCRPLSGLSGNDILIYSDLDEIPNPQKIREILHNFDQSKVYHFAQRQFYFYLNLEEVSGKLLSYAGDYDGVYPKQWLGPYMFSIRLLERFSIEQLRVDKSKENSFRVVDGGWHFTYMGGAKSDNLLSRVEHKIKSAAHQEFNNNKILSKLDRRIKAQKDIFGRSSNFRRINIDESFPDYLLSHLADYEYLILPEENKPGFFLNAIRWISSVKLRLK